MRLLYISQGNIPSKWAHTMQAMKMAEALGALVVDFRMIVQVHWTAFLRRRFDYDGWYGIRRPFRIVRLPSWRAPRSGVFEQVWDDRFDRVAARYAVKHNADAVFTRSPKAGRLCVENGLHTVVESHLRPDHGKFRHLQAVASEPHFLGVVTIAEELKEFYVANGIPGEKICVWPDAVDLRTFEDLPDRDSIRNRIGVPLDAFLVIHCGHLYEDRGIDEILVAARRLPELHFLLVGGWEEEVARRKEEAKDLVNVKFTGFVPNTDVPAYLAAGDVLLMPYSAECRPPRWMSPMKLFEYMASRRPIIATDLPALRKHLEHGRNSLLIALGDADALVEAIEEVVSRPQDAGRLAEAAYEDVRPHTWDNRARDVLARFFTGRTDA